MSLVFSNPTLKSGICERVDKRIGTSIASYSLIDKASDANEAVNCLNFIALQAGGTWQVDDTNQGDYPIVMCDLNSGQRDYSFLKDGSGNLILDIYKVMVADVNGIYHDMTPTNMQADAQDQSFYDGLNLQGNPQKYDKTANGIFFDVIPNYSFPKGIKLFINRESTYFLSTDTTKMPGFAGLLHEYIVAKMAYLYASANSLPQAGGRQRNGAYTGLAMEVNDWEANKIPEYYGNRIRDEKPVLMSKSSRVRGWR